jgi:hypothetical protein
MSRRVVAALPSPSFDARVIARTPLFYRTGADASLDRPAHVRAGSALARLGPGTFAVVQDDASFLAIVEGVGGAVTVRDVPLPAGDGVRQFDDVRGNKHAKLDLEACLVLEAPSGPLLVAFGSGSSPARERIVLVERAADRSDDPRVTVVDAPQLYAALRADPSFAGSELNIEGAAIADDDVVLLQRGNGAVIGDRAAVDATVRIDRASLLAYLLGLAHGDRPLAPPSLRDVTPWHLGALDGTRLTFTDAATAPGRWTAFLACAEASPDATRDGPVSGVAIGRFDDRAREAAYGTIADERGEPLRDKAEGLAFDDDDPERAWVVIDRDEPAAAAELLDLRLGPGWQT